jgi:voltage-gated potassium channel
MILSVASILILQFEVGAPDGNIKTGGEALWWAIVTITTVGYGDFYPVTFLGRLTAVVVMFAGIGIIGALASILASLLVAPASPDDAETGEPAATSTAGAAASVVASPVAAAPGAAATVADPGSAAAIVAELASLRAEIAAMRAALPAEPG